MTSPKRKVPRTKKNGDKLRKLRTEFFGEHKFALEYTVLEYVLRGYTANRIARQLAVDLPELKGERISETTLLWVLKRGIENQIVQIKPPRRVDLEKKLGDIYRDQQMVRFYVSDDSVGPLNARSMTRFFWSLAAEVINGCIATLVEEKNEGGANDEEIVIGNTGGLSASEAIKYLTRVSFDPDFLYAGRKRLCFLSLTAVGTAEHFDLHANYLAALLSNIYSGRHMAVMDRLSGKPEDSSPMYDQRISAMRMLIGGVGSEAGYLWDWFKRNNIEPPPGMIGDIFFHPIDKNGHLLNLDEKTAEALKPLQLRPTKEELGRFLHQTKSHRSLIIVTEPEVNGKRKDKKGILDVVLRSGFVTDCVLGSDLAERLVGLNAGKKLR